MRVVTFKALMAMTVLAAAATGAEAQIAGFPADGSRNEIVHLHALQFDTPAFHPADDDARTPEELPVVQGTRPDWTGGLAFGPLRIAVENGDVGPDGRRVRLAGVHLKDVHILGGAVSGTFNGRAAALHLTWSLDK
jgi:hypothetical protein